MLTIVADRSSPWADGVFLCGHRPCLLWWSWWKSAGTRTPRLDSLPCASKRLWIKSTAHWRRAKPTAEEREPQNYWPLTRSLYRHCVTRPLDSSAGISPNSNMLFICFVLHWPKTFFYRELLFFYGSFFPHWTRWDSHFPSRNGLKEKNTDTVWQASNWTLHHGIFLAPSHCLFKHWRTFKICTFQKNEDIYTHRNAISTHNVCVRMILNTTRRTL